MTVGFFHVDRETQHSLECRDCARIMVEIAKRMMKTTPVVQFTDMTSDTIKGVDAVLRKPTEPMALLRMRHHASVKGDWVFVDPDVVFQRTVRPVFDDATFDVGVTTRNWSHLRAAEGFTQRMPFNTGVVFSRGPRFWREVYRRLRDKPKEQQEWMGDQEVIGEIVAENEEMRWFEIAHLKGSAYNYPPELPEPDIDREAAAAIVHYKGPKRKAIMMRRYGKGAKACA